MDKNEREYLDVRAGQVFVPATPVSQDGIFAGRFEQIRRVVDAVNQAGQHAIVFGERGVGKTSLANILATKLSVDDKDTSIIAPRINCDGNDTFGSVWKKVFRRIYIQRHAQTAGFNSKQIQEKVRASESIAKPATPDEVVNMLMLMAPPHNKSIIIIIIDEFDRLTNKGVRRTIADTIKALSDYDVRATVVLVGVADSVDGLISEHQSIERALVQVQMPRMSPEEIQEILDTGMERLSMTMDQEAKNRIGLIAQGLPHYTHALGLYSTRQAISQSSKEVTCAHLSVAITQAANQAQQSLQRAYHQAVSSPRKGNIYPQVLLACSLANPDKFGYFAAADVKKPISDIMKKPYEIGGFKKHLDDFIGEKRGRILQRTGTARKYRYRFGNPLLPSLIIIKGLIENRTDIKALDQVLPRTHPLL